MSQQVQELINKIKTEGIQEAEQKAQEIEKEANNKAQQIIKDAHRQAEKLIVDAKEEIKKMQEATLMALKQSSRDALLSLRKSIEAVMQKIVQTEVNDALTAEQLAQILETVIIKSLEDQKNVNDVRVFLNKKDLDKLDKDFTSKLQKKIKTTFKLQASDDIGKGFLISFDQGKSNFDFTDESLAEFLGLYLNEQISQLVKESVS
ncbi:MAG: hypothetical protein H6755_02100 [Candidatus Omnitrophica bacterium]|nr:hypothetical protein [Candidatus Omnitrophota bacterium]MCB9747181.1 hypothetical protein [Candidatus Omnitrophota bacterium]